MPIKTLPNGGGTLCTGQGVTLFQLLSLKGRMNLEASGLKFRGPSTAAYLMQRYNIPGKATKKNRAEALRQLLAEIETVGAQVKNGA